MNNLVKFLKSNGINTNVGKFEFIKVIGEGGNSFVYLFKKNNNNFAIKFLKLDSNTDKIRRFQDEYFSLTQIPDKKWLISQYHLDKVIINYGDNMESKEYYIIISKYYDMNLVKYRETVFTTLSDEDKSIAFYNIFKQLINSLITLYKNKIIHRDIKPENIFIEINEDNPTETNLVLGDFGIAHFDKELYARESHTDTNERLGNRDFSAPEQSRKGAEISYSADIFAFGQVLFWLKYGRPFKGVDYLSNNEITDQIIKICLNQNPKERFKNAEDIKDYIISSQSNRYNLQEFLFDFDRVIRKNAPEIDTILTIKDEIEIDNLINDLNDINKNNFLWYMNMNEGDNHLTSLSKSPFTKGMHILKTDSFLCELNISDITLFRDNHNPFNNLIIIRTKSAIPFIYLDKFNRVKPREIDENKMCDYASYIDEKCIDPDETKNAFYRNKNGESLHISELNHHHVERQIKPFLYVIAPKGTSLNDWSRDGKSTKILSKIMNSDVISTEDIKNFLSHIQSSSKNYKDNLQFR
jgi:hypothetical protein